MMFCDNEVDLDIAHVHMYGVDIYTFVYKIWVGSTKVWFGLAWLVLFQFGGLVSSEEWKWNNSLAAFK